MRRFGRLVPGTLFVGICAAFFVVFWSSATRLALTEITDRIKAAATQEADLLQSLTSLGSANTGMDVPDEEKWSGVDEASVEIALQQSLLDIAERSNLQLVSFGASSEIPGAGQDTVAYQLELTGDQANMARFLDALEKVRPALAVQYLWLRQLPADPQRELAPVDLRLTVWGFRKIVSEEQ